MKSQPKIIPEGDWFCRIYQTEQLSAHLKARSISIAKAVEFH
jgi:hypothetical protein